jgi:polyhydroxyalkanoate synthesis regulator protein
VLKAYKNRNRNIYIGSYRLNFQRLYEAVKQDDIEVLDFRTKQDITYDTLLRAICWHESFEKNNLSVAKMNEIIRAGGFVAYLKRGANHP